VPSAGGKLALHQMSYHLAVGGAGDAQVAIEEEIAQAPRRYSVSPGLTWLKKVLVGSWPMAGSNAAMHH